MMSVEVPGLAEETRSFAISLMLLMGHPTFKSVLWRSMTHEERLHLYALHQQACYGDAPREYTAITESWLRSSVFSPLVLPPKQAKSSGELGTKARDSGAETLAASSSSSFLSWVNISARLRHRRWAALRGRMTPALAVEAFCTEFLALMVRHEAFQLVPLVESALLRANYEAISASEQTPAQHLCMHKSFSFGKLYTKAIPSFFSRARVRTPARPSPPIVFCVYAFEQDPAALAMMWLCRTHGIPYEITLESLPSCHSGSIGQVFCRLLTQHTSASDLRSLKNMSQNWQDVDRMPFCCSIRLGGHSFPVFTPESGFQLLFDVFLSNVPHWGKLFVTNFPLSPPGGDCSSQPGETFTAKTSTLSPVRGCSLPPRQGPAKASFFPTDQQKLQAVVRSSTNRSAWMELLQSITIHLREPIMQLSMDSIGRVPVADVSSHTSSSPTARRKGPNIKSPSSGSVGNRKIDSLGIFNCSRKDLLRTTARHFHIFEQHFLQSIRTHQEQATCASDTVVPTPSDAAVKAVLSYFKTTNKKLRRLVNMADVYIACCAYLFCTSTFTQDVFPVTFSPSLLFKPTHATEFVLSRNVSTYSQEAIPHIPRGTPLSQFGFGNAPDLIQNSPTQVPPPLAKRPICLSGVSSLCNELLNRVMQEEANIAQHRMLHTGPLHLSASAPNKDNAESDVKAFMALAQKQQTLSVTPHHMACMVGVAAEGIERLIFTRLGSFDSDELDPNDRTNQALRPFLVLAHILSQSWRLSQQQCVGFPYLMLNPKRRASVMMEFLQKQASTHHNAQGKDVGHAISIFPPQKGVETQGSALVMQKRLTSPTSDTTGGQSRPTWARILQSTWRMVAHISADNSRKDVQSEPLTESRFVYTGKNTIESKI